MSDPLLIFTPSGRRGSFPPGTIVLDAARSLGVDIDSVCGGRGICGRCQIRPMTGTFAKHGIESAAGHLSAPGAIEADYERTRAPLMADCRLACAATLQGDLVADVPPESQVHRQVVRKG
ncbi:MAG TPA: 2Fe-2S iron-sulfur cluster-binding protein, partial [Candidatus Limnocylindrales bacterium]